MKQSTAMIRAQILLRIGLAAVFLYAAVGATLQPDNWIGYLPLALRHAVPAGLLLAGFSLFQLALALWLLTGWRVRYAAFVTAITIIGIMATNLGALDITFRDITMFFAALALAVLAA